jgi:hypothetical protein
MSEKEPWGVLSKIDVSQHIEKKNGLSYLSWAWAWGVLKQHYPGAWFRKHENMSGLPYFKDEQGYAFVRVTVGLDATGDNDVTETLPVLDHRNRSIQNPDSFAVNNSLQRCLTKAIAYHGLGHYIYAGEDLPQQDGSQSQPEARQSGNSTSQVSGTAASGKASTGSPDQSDGVDTNQAPEIVASTMIAFIPQCSDMKELNGFYSKNKKAVAYLEASNKDLHQSVITAFSKRKSELKEA